MAAAFGNGVTFEVSSKGTKLGIADPGGRVLVLPDPDFGLELMHAARQAELKEILERLFAREPYEIMPYERRLLGQEIFELDITRGRLLENIQWLDTFVSFVLGGDSGLRLRELSA